MEDIVCPKCKSRLSITILRDTVITIFCNKAGCYFWFDVTKQDAINKLMEIFDKITKEETKQQ